MFSLDSETNDLFQPTIHHKSLTKGYWDPKRGKRSNFVSQIVVIIILRIPLNKYIYKI